MNVLVVETHIVLYYVGGECSHVLARPEGEAIQETENFDCSESEQSKERVRERRQWGKEVSGCKPGTSHSSDHRQPDTSLSS